MEPIPETLQALDELEAHVDDVALGAGLVAVADNARKVAPGLVGVSIASREHEVTFTLVATDEEIATLDAVQYVSSGPCVDAIDLGHGIATSPGGLLGEARWRDFARASAAAGVHSTLTLPVMEADGDVVATVNLYGRTADTFEGRHQQLADAFGAWAPGADHQRRPVVLHPAQAQEAPGRLREAAVSTPPRASSRPSATSRWQRPGCSSRTPRSAPASPSPGSPASSLGLHDDVRTRRALAESAEAEVRPSGR